MHAAPTLSEVMRFIKFIAGLDNGLAILLGRMEPPSAVAMYDLKKGPQTEYGVHIDGGGALPLAQNIIENRYDEIVRWLGGWDNITRAFRDYRAQWPETWELFAMYSTFVHPGGDIRDGKGGALAMIGRRFDGIVPKTVRRRRNKIIRTIALFIITHPHDGEMVLYDDPELDKKLN